MLVETKYMQRCIDLARNGEGYVSPNPMVGAVIVCNDRIIGEGYHHRYGEAHAEPNAILSVTNPDLLRSSTLYVNLEPCAHYGKTPPCAELIKQCGIPRVVIGIQDPNPKVSGKGIEIMRKAGIEVVTRVMEKECRELNKRFLTFQEKKRPFILLKWAQTADGFIDNIRESVEEKPLMISNEITRMLTHKMRAENQSILVGTNTVLLDNPHLTVRSWEGKSPIRIIIDKKGIAPEHYHVFDGTVPTIVFTEQNRVYPEKANLKYIRIQPNEPDLIAELIRKIHEKSIHSVLVEGGAKLLNSFIASGYWDEINIEISPLKTGKGVPAPRLNISPVTHKKLGGNEWIHFYNPSNPI